MIYNTLNLFEENSDLDYDLVVDFAIFGDVFGRPWRFEHLLLDIGDVRVGLGSCQTGFSLSALLPLQTEGVQLAVN